MLMLKSARKAKGYTQAEVAAVIGISQNGYSQWENGARRIDKDSLSKLADLFGVSTDYLLGRTNDKKPPVKDGRQSADAKDGKTQIALDLMDRLTPENQAKAQDYIDLLLARQEADEGKQ